MPHRRRALSIAVRAAVVAIAGIVAIVVLHATLISALVFGATITTVMLDALLHAEREPPAHDERTLTVDLRRRP